MLANLGMKEHRKTIVVQLTGGLGNQLFSYASGRGISDKLGAKLRFHRSKNITDGERAYRLDRFRTKVVDAALWQEAMVRISLERRVQTVGAALGPRVRGRLFDVVQDNTMGYSPELFPQDRSIFLRGFWQSPKYFSHIEKEIREELEMIESPREKDRPILEKIRNTESVCVHVRRGDLVNNPEFAAKYHVQEPGYYQRAVQMLKQLGRPLHFFVFSDDADWPRKHLPLGDEVEFLCAQGAAGREDWQDFQLMRACKHFIIANSTFSWWTAWLGACPDKRVIAPRAWYRDSDSPPPDLIPSHWKVLA
jgi:hypothetical protein